MLVPHHVLAGAPSRVLVPHVLVLRYQVALRPRPAPLRDIERAVEELLELMTPRVVPFVLACVVGVVMVWLGEVCVCEWGGSLFTQDAQTARATTDNAPADSSS